ncbi:tetratricopeptide repeat protein [Flavobacterium sp. Fl-77]|uniref:Tetratricopeptide repeat protein n=1 Tax=Flavobacterium flavipigmentatum TaxID=2893884 RepID=A0AAJ2SJJ4_9FLAO|nr:MULTISPECIES: tetratricopeptide repeat protein [unclassified Flavobacterium]MDX6183695.1 tetratricopeptide repeat protein [Flavobacterium sp. Fl-33]MDX6187344.1 tetratricopeptide repeat protein [Flavobacterium sp. Fl-77]UFH38158.1 tetratricopeptide repeat protein [Flavobacterium sp. F-70]
MKSKYVILASALLISLATFAQKDQIKSAEKALKSGDAQGAIAILKDAENIIVNAKDVEQAQFYFIKGNAFLDLANKKVEEGKNLSQAAESYQKLIEIEKQSGKPKYSAQAAGSVTEIKGKLINAAIADSQANKHADGAKKLYDAYLLDKKDTINLYYAASTAVNSQDYDLALPMYEELKKLNYSGKGTSFTAVSKTNGEVQGFSDAKQRDLAVKLGTHEKPETENIPSKRGEIYKNYALILLQKGRTEDAKKAIADARKANPEDSSLILSEANLYLETKDYDTYKKLVGEALQKDPNNADLIFNLGVISNNAKNPVDAEKYYLKTIEINPNYTNAYINLAALKLEAEKPIIDEMNKLGTSAKDMKRYDVLKAQRENVFKSVIPYLKKANELDPKNEDITKTLIGVYSALEMTAEAKALKAKK